MYVCICHAVTDAEVASHVAAGAANEEAVARACGAGTGCGSCVERICAMISAVHPQHGPAALQPTG